MKNKTTIFIVAQIIIIIVLIWVIVLLANKDILGNHSDEGESEEEIIVDYTTIVDGIKQIQLPSAVEKNSNIQYKKLEETKTNQKKLK
jgi:membrane protein involved in colicin uptake